MGVWFACLNCGKEFNVYPSRAKKGEVKTCSKECKYEYAQKEETGKRHLVKCECCGKEFLRYDYRTKNKQNFCSIKCMGKAKENKVDVTCECCGKKFSIKKSVFDSNCSRFCSWDCRVNFYQDEETLAKREIRDKFYGSYAWKKLARMCKQHYDYTCQMCGKQSKHVHVHHVVPREMGGSDEFDNLTVLCGSCHSKADFIIKRALKQST